MNQGFTLIELLVVVLIIGVLAAVALPQYQTAIERSRATEALIHVDALSKAMQRYYNQREAWPNAAALSALDVDLPKRTDCPGGTAIGGKHFCIFINFHQATDTSITILANRARLKDGSYANGAYQLLTKIDALGDGTFSTTRGCRAINDDDEAISYCNAITGGHNNF